MGIQAPKVKLLVDNKLTIALSKNHLHHDHSKDIDRRYHFVCDCVERGEVDIDHVSTSCSSGRQSDEGTRAHQVCGAEA
jgi:hypothetical protein